MFTRTDCALLINMSSDSSHGPIPQRLSCGACVGTAADIRMVILLFIPTRNRLHVGARE